MKFNHELKTFAAAVLVEMMPVLDEKQQRFFANIVATNLGYGGVSFVNSITGQSRNTIVAAADYDDLTVQEKEESTSIPGETTKATAQTTSLC